MEGDGDESTFGDESVSQKHRGKIVAKFEDGVQMGLGFIFEAKSSAGDNPGQTEEARVFDFKPHYQVALRSPNGADKVSYPQSLFMFNIADRLSRQE